MSIHLLRLHRFRHFTSFEFTPHPRGITLLTGENGSGKTSILEAIHCLSLGRSFRSAKLEPLIQQDQNDFVIFSEIVADNTRYAGGLQRTRSGKQVFQWNHEERDSVATIAAHLPVRVLHAELHALFTAPDARRQYLDWGVFYHEPAFLNHWRHYMALLKQRNALLKSHQSDSEEFMAWTRALAAAGEGLHDARVRYLAVWTGFFDEMLQSLLPGCKITAQYEPGWTTSLGLEEALLRLQPHEMRVGHTLAGPHRADLSLLIDGQLARHFLSRGQQKLLICAMIVAQGALCMTTSGKRLVYLVDDLPAELDNVSRERLLSLLWHQQAQIFVTAINGDDILTAFPHRDDLRMFHVKHQDINEQVL